MKVGITTFGGDGGKSGISRYIIQLLAEFAKINDNSLEFEVIGYHDEQHIFCPAGEFPFLGLGDQIRSPVKNIWWHQTQLPKLCRQRRYDAIFLPAANRRIPWHCPCPMVGTVHDFSSIHVKGKYDKKRIFYITKVLPMLVRRLQTVITVSESSKKDILNFARVPKERVHVIPLAADKSEYHCRDRQESHKRVASAYNIKAPYLLYISRIEHPGKNHVRLLEAFVKLKQQHQIPHQLVFAGSDWLRAEEVHRAAENSGYHDDIIFTGFAANEDLPFLYSGADVFVFPSLYEGFGLPILEAMACQVPVACSNVSSLPEVAGDSAVLFDPEDSEDMAKAIRTLLDSVKRQEYVDKGIQQSAQYDWKITAERTLDIFKRLQ